MIARFDPAQAKLESVEHGGELRRAAAEISHLVAQFFDGAVGKRLGLFEATD